jgi:N-acetylneuraminate synthase
VAAKRKPVVLSTGASTMGEIDTAVNELVQAGCEDIVLLHCILNYPTQNKNAQLRMISGLKHAYPEWLIGYSDHTLPDSMMTPLITAYLLGAVVIEKHFTYDKSLLGNDHYHAMDAHDLKRFISLVDKIELLQGCSEIKSPIPTEALSRKNARRSIVLTRDLDADHIICEGDLTYKRPGTGISPEHWDLIIGRQVSHNLKADDILLWEDLKSLD